MGDDAVLGIILPFYRFLLRERVSHVHQICSGSDFTLRESLYILVKFYLLRLLLRLEPDILSFLWLKKNLHIIVACEM